MALVIILMGTKPSNNAIPHKPICSVPNIGANKRTGNCPANTFTKLRGMVYSGKLRYVVAAFRMADISIRNNGRMQRLKANMILAISDNVGASSME